MHLGRGSTCKGGLHPREREYASGEIYIWGGGLKPGKEVCIQRVGAEHTAAFSPPSPILRDTVNEWAVRILLECTLVNSCRFLSRCLFVVFAMPSITYIPSSFLIQGRLLQKLQFKFPLFLKINRHIVHSNQNYNIYSTKRKLEGNLDLTDLEMPNLDLYDLDLDLTDLDLNDVDLFELDLIKEFNCLMRL